MCPESNAICSPYYHNSSMYAIKTSVSIKHLTNDDEHVRQNCIANYVGVLLKMSCTPKPNGFADHYPY